MKQTLIKKFSVGANEDILAIKEIRDTIEGAFGTSALTNKKSITMEIASLICDSDTKIQLRHFYDIPTYFQDTLGGVFFAPETKVAQLISLNSTTGTLYIIKHE